MELRLPMNYSKNNYNNKIEFESLKKIILYNDNSTPNLRLPEVKDYLKAHLVHPEIILRDEFCSFYIDYNKSTESDRLGVNTGQSKNLTELAKRLVDTKVRDLSDPKKIIKPLSGEIAVEEKLLSDTSKALPGIFYDGHRLHEVFQWLLPDDELDLSTCHLIFTPRLFGTFDKHDKRYHARVILCGYPSIISTSGIIEAPAKPKDYYVIKQNLINQNIATIEGFIPDELKQKYLRYNDPRLTEVLKGYSMQAIFYHLINEPFCVKTNCRLFNAHWQEEVLQAQLTEPEFCENHEEFLNKFKNQ